MASRRTKNGARKNTRGTDKHIKYMGVSAKLRPTNEVFPIPKVHNEMTIRELRAFVELASGVPFNMQKLRYLDEGDLLDNNLVRSYDVVSGARFNLDVWNMWTDLVEAVATGDISQVFSLGVTESSTFKTPNSEYMSASSRSAWITDRACVALFVASHRGHQKLVQALIDAGANVNGATALGRTALHVAAFCGHGHIVDQLLNAGADIEAIDEFGDTPLTIAKKFNHKECERKIFLFSWQQRAKKLSRIQEHPLFPHQCFDSSYPVWLKDVCRPQIYCSTLPCAQEFERTRINAPRKKSANSADRTEGLSDVNHTTTSANRNIGATIQSTGSSRGRHLEDNFPTFNDWLERKKANERMAKSLTLNSEETFFVPKPAPARHKHNSSDEVKQNDENETEPGKSSVEDWNPKTGADVLKRIAERRLKEPTELPGNFQDWFAEMDLDLVEKIQTGETALQVKLKEGKV